MFSVDDKSPCHILERVIPDHQMSNFNIATSQRLLSEANKCFASMLPAVADKQPRQQTPVAESARGYVAAIEGLQQQVVAFALPAPASSKAALEQQAAALRQELHRADALLQEASTLVQQWQLRCQHMRDAHEAVMTEGIGQQPAQQGQPAAMDADGPDAAGAAP